MRVMEKRNRVLWVVYPDTLNNMNNLAFTLKGPGRDDKAILFYNYAFALEGRFRPSVQGLRV
jgi:hypothetical protein